MNRRTFFGWIAGLVGTQSVVQAQPKKETYHCGLLFTEEELIEYLYKYYPEVKEYHAETGRQVNRDSLTRVMVNLSWTRCNLKYNLLDGGDFCFIYKPHRFINPNFPEYTTALHLASISIDEEGNLIEPKGFADVKRYWLRTDSVFEKKCSHPVNRDSIDGCFLLWDAAGGNEILCYHIGDE